MRPFLTSGLVVVSLTMALLLWAFQPSFTAHVVVIPPLVLLSTGVVGVLADRAPFAWWLGPACALAVLAVGALAVPLCNGPDLLRDPSAFGVRPLVLVLEFGFLPAVLAGLGCSAYARFAR